MDRLARVRDFFEKGADPSLFSPNFVSYAPWDRLAQKGAPESQYTQTYKPFPINELFTRVTVRVEDAFEEGDKVVVRWRLNGTWTGPVPGLKLRPTGKPIDLTGINIYEFSGDQIIAKYGELNVGAFHADACAQVRPEDCVEALGAVSIRSNPGSRLARVQDYFQKGPAPGLFSPNFVSYAPWDRLAQKSASGSPYAGSYSPFPINNLFTNLTVKMEDAFEEGDKVVVRWRLSGTWTGPIPNLKLRPTGNPVELTGINIYEFSGDQIVAKYGEFNVGAFHADACAQFRPEECVEALATVNFRMDSGARLALIRDYFERGPAPDLFASNFVSHAPWDRLAQKSASGSPYSGSYSPFSINDLFTNLTVKVEDAFEEGERVVVRWGLKGTWTGPIPGLKLRPTGKPIELTGINIYEFAGNQITAKYGELNVGAFHADACSQVRPQDCVEALAAVNFHV